MSVMHECDYVLLYIVRSSQAHSGFHFFFMHLGFRLFFSVSFAPEESLVIFFRLGRSLFYGSIKEEETQRNPHSSRSTRHSKAKLWMSTGQFKDGTYNNNVYFFLWKITHTNTKRVPSHNVMMRGEYMSFRYIQYINIYNGRMYQKSLLSLTCRYNGKSHGC